jgi:hypothetical protein
MFILFIYLIGFIITTFIKLKYFSEHIWDHVVTMTITTITGILWPVIILPFIIFLIGKYILKIEVLMR